MVDLRETLEFLKWSFGRSSAYVFFDSRFYDEYMEGVISREIIPRFDYTKRFHNFDIMQNTLDGDCDPEFGNVIRELTESDLKMMKRDFKPKSYSSFPLYTFCSWDLNKEFRKLHDEISSFVYSS
ncbi:MAG: hypothetical protein AABW91_02070 [Nanoarchaeota archaeon]